MMGATREEMSMVIPAPGDKPLEVRSEDGQVIAYIVPVEQMSRLRAENDSLREQVALLQRQKGHYIAKLTEALKTRFPPLPTPEQMADPSQWATSDDIRQIIADLESR